MVVSPIRMVFAFFSAAVTITCLVLFDAVIMPVINAWAHIVETFGFNYADSVAICQGIVPVALLIIGGVSVFILVFTAFSNSTEENPYLNELQRF